MVIQENLFSYFLTKSYFVGTQMRGFVGALKTYVKMMGKKILTIF